MSHLTTQTQGIILRKLPTEPESSGSYTGIIDSITGRVEDGRLVAYIVNFIDNIILTRKKKLDERKTAFRTSTQEVHNSTIDYNTIDPNTIKEVLKQFKTILIQANDQDEVKLLLKTLIKKITIDADRNIDTITLHIDENIIRLIYSTNAGEMPTGISSFILQKSQCELIIYCEKND